MRTYLKWCLLGIFVVACQNASTPVFDVEGIEIRELIAKADFIFEGEVVGIDYRSAENNGTGRDDNEDGTEDAGRLPHTFVTYKIKNVFKGQYTEEHITLRFVGGLDENNDYLVVGRIPLYDIGEKDFIFMKDNTSIGCPLVKCQTGRMRAARSTQDEQDMIYTEDGHEMLLFEGAGQSILIQGAYTKISDVLVHSYIDHNGDEQVFEMVDTDHIDRQDNAMEETSSQIAALTSQEKHSVHGVDDLNREDLFGLPGTRLSAKDFRNFLRQAVELYGNLAPIKEIMSANINETFVIGSLVDDAFGAMNSDPRLPSRIESDADALERELMQSNTATGQNDDVILTPEQIERIRVLREIENSQTREQ